MIIASLEPDYYYYFFFARCCIVWKNSQLIQRKFDLYWAKLLEYCCWFCEKWFLSFWMLDCFKDQRNIIQTNHIVTVQTSSVLLVEINPAFWFLVKILKLDERYEKRCTYFKLFSYFVMKLIIGSTELKYFLVIPRGVVSYISFNKLILYLVFGFHCSQIFLSKFLKQVRLTNT